MNEQTPIDGIELWLAWKQTHELVRSAVIGDVARDSKVSEAELTVLVQLGRGGGRLRQSVLAQAMGWDRTRVSHLITRMASRGYLERTRNGSAVEVRISESGAAVFKDARGRLEEAVERHMLSQLIDVDLAALARILEALAPRI